MAYGGGVFCYGVLCVFVSRFWLLGFWLLGLFGFSAWLFGLAFPAALHQVVFWLSRLLFGLCGLGGSFGFGFQLLIVFLGDFSKWAFSRSPFGPRTWARGRQTWMAEYRGRVGRLGSRGSGFEEPWVSIRPSPKGGVLSFLEFRR